MKTAGEILSAARQERNWDLEELSRRTKIQVRYLAAIEKSNLELLPQEPFVKGFIRAAAVELGLKPDGMIAIFRRDFGVNQKGQIIPRALNQTSRHHLTWTPQITVFSAIAVTTAAFFIYLIFQLKIFISPPALTLTYPQFNALVGQNVLVEGQTNPDAVVSINNQEIKKNKNGAFSQTIQLTPGAHIITVTAVNQNGKSATLQRAVQVKGE